jgi:hypothetical protein
VNTERVLGIVLQVLAIVAFVFAIVVLAQLAD